MEAIGAVILAAGSSTRLGQPKQLLQYCGESLIRRAARVALAAGCLEPVVVVGDGCEPIERELSGLAARMHHCPDWRSGIGCSIRFGVAEALTHHPSLDGLLIMVCDQPFVSVDLLVEIIVTRRKTRKPAVACTYAGTIGVPALFHRSLFPALASLRGEQGAKVILAARPEEVAGVAFSAGAVDIDTPDDLRAHLDGTLGKKNETGTTMQNGSEAGGWGAAAF